MSDHAWTRENVAAFVMGGLTAEEMDRLEGHVRDCPDCAAAVAAARRVDRGLDSLFADVRPGLGLEDGAIQSIRTARGRRFAVSDRLLRFAVAAGILLMLGVVGAMAGALVSDGRLPLPGSIEWERAGRQSAPTAASAEVVKRSDGAKMDGYTSSTGETATSSGSDAKVDLASKDFVVSGEGRRGDGPTSGLAQNWSFGFRQQPSAKGGASFGISGGISGGPGNASQFGFPQQPSGYAGAAGAIGITGGVNGIAGGSVSGGGIGGGISGGIGGGIGGAPGASTSYGDMTVSGGTPSVTFQPGSSIPTRGVPVQQKPNSDAVITGGVLFGASPQSVENGRVSPVLTKGFNQGGTPTFSPPGQNLAVSPTFSAGNINWFVPADNRPAAPAEVKQPEPGTPAKPDPGDPKPPAAAVPAPASHRIVIRSGDMEFEIESFDAAAATITKLVAGLKGAFVATVNSDKLANGKVRGSITVRTPPEHLDGLVLSLRRDLGPGSELKGMKISSQDITKQYADLESRLRGARAMEQRLLQMIKDGKGEIKQLLEAEKELGIWRTRIEEFEGEMRYYANLAALATLTITLTEKEIRTAAAVTESEKVQAGVEVEDVDKAYQQTLAAVAEAKGRVAKSELKQLAAGQLNASLQFEVPPDAGGPIRDRLRQLGRVARLEIDRSQHAVGGSPPADVKVKRGDTLFLVQLYNLSNVAARETTTLQVAVLDVRTAYQALRDAAVKAAARVLVAQFNEQDVQNVTAQIEVEVRRGEDGAFRAALDAAGEVVSRQVSRAAEGDAATDTKVKYQATIFGINRLGPRDTTTLQVAVPDVRAAYQALRDAAGKAAARVLAAQLNEQDTQHVTAQIDVEVRRADEAAFRSALDAAGEVVSRQGTRAPEGASVTDSKVQYRTILLGVNRLSPRETTSLTLEVQDVDQALAAFGGQVAEAKGRQVSAQSTRDQTGKVTAQASYEVPLAAAGLADRFKSAGAVRGYQSTRDPQAPAGKYATARIDVTLVSGDQIVAEGNGVWPQVRRGLTVSMMVLLTSVSWVVVGLCVFLPWGLIGYAAYRLFRRPVRPVTPAPQS